MMEPGSRPEEAAGLRIDAVEVQPTDLHSVLLRVAGAWEGPLPQELRAPVLVLRNAGGENRIEALPETSEAAARAAPEPQPFRAAFSVPDALAPLLSSEGAELDLGPLTVPLPAPASRADDEEADDVEGTVVDRAVLAERRAKRAELAEEANATPAGEAEQALAVLEGELGKLELRLAAATRERAEFEAGLARRDREAAESERRGAAAEAEAARLRERLMASTERGRQLGRELEATRRRADEARQAEAAAASIAARSEREAAERDRDLDARLRELRERVDAAVRAEVETAKSRDELAGAMARANVVRLELGALRREVELAAAHGAASPRSATEPTAPGPVQAAALAGERRLAAATPGSLDAARLRAESHLRARTLEAAERTIAEARDTVADVQDELDRERAERASAESELRARAERERTQLEARLAALERQRRELAARVEAELNARRAAEAELEAMRDRVADLERSLADQESHESDRIAGQARLETSIAALRAELARVRADAERQARERDRLTDRLKRTVAELRAELEGVGGRLTAELEAQRARTLSAEAEAREAAERLAQAERAAAAAAPETEARRTPRRAPSGSSWLAGALRRLSRADEAAAARLALQLLPGQALVVSAPLDYDLEAGSLGRHRVTVRAGEGELARLAALRSRRAADFRVAATPGGLVELVVAGGASRPAGIRITRTLRRRRALSALPAVPMRLADLARAGILPQPGLLYQALAEAIDPAWTRGHHFTVVLEIDGPRGGVWSVTAADGAPLAVVDGRPGDAPNAAVYVSQVGLQHLLDGEPPPPDAKPAMRGDLAAIGLLGQWTEWARWLGELGD